jgi:hypothetical protein
MCGSGWALVNVFIEQEGAGMLWQIDNNYVDHGLLWHCGTVGQSFTWRPGDFTSQCKNISIRNCAWENMGCGSSSKGGATDCNYLGNTAMTIDNNHFIGSSFNQGINATTGTLTFVDQANDDFHPAAGSPLINRVTDLIVPCDVENEARGETTAVGAFKGPDEINTGISWQKAIGSWQPPHTPWIYPNPGANLMNIQCPITNVQCPIYDIRGNRVLNREQPEPGVYYLKYGGNIQKIIMVR